MFKSQKHVFWQALIVTVFIFGIGIFLGMLLENSRIGGIVSLYQESEVNLLDLKLQSEIFSNGDFNCGLAIKENIKFADKIFEEGKILERYEGASRLDKEKLSIQHKKFDILRAMLFLNSLKIKENCGEMYHNIVYFYELDTPSLDKKAKQNVFSKLLKELKEKRGNEILLIPIAANSDVGSINLILNQYNISLDELPVILIDEKDKINDLQTVDEIEQHLK